MQQQSPRAPLPLRRGSTFDSFMAWKPLDSAKSSKWSRDRLRAEHERVRRAKAFLREQVCQRAVFFGLEVLRMIVSLVRGLQSPKGPSRRCRGIAREPTSRAALDPPSLTGSGKFRTVPSREPNT